MQEFTDCTWAPGQGNNDADNDDDVVFLATMLGYRSQVFIPVLGLVNFPLNRHNRQRPGFGTPQKMLHLADRWNYEIEKYDAEP